MNKNELTNEILVRCPSLAPRALHGKLRFEQALVAMSQAHRLNGGYYIGLYETALQYLKSIDRKDVFKQAGVMIPLEKYDTKG